MQQTGLALIKYFGIFCAGNVKQLGIQIIGGFSVKWRQTRREALLLE